MKSRSTMLGLTLIELLIALVIIGILTAIAVPTYQGSLLKAGRAAAKGALMDVALRQEQHFINNLAYSTSLAGLGLPDPYYFDKSTDQVAAADTARAYQLTLANTTTVSYDAVATAVHAQSGDLCGNYTLKSDGTRLTSGAAGAEVCW
jgi:type IV pilus assembly protein PilE